MKEKKIIFIGTPLIASKFLENLIINNYNIVSVVTQNPTKKNRGMKTYNSPVYEMASKHKIEVLTPFNLEDDFYDKIKKIEPDLIVVMAYGKILPLTYLELPKFGCINIHVSLLPRWRGASPIEHSILNGDVKTGISIIKMVKRLDAGPILSQIELKIDKNIDKEILTNNLTKLGIKLLIKTLPKIFNESILPKEQDEKLVTYAKKISPDMRKINFNKNTEQILNLIKAHSPSPCAWFTYKKERIKIISATKGKNIGTSSTIINSNFELGCKDGSILPMLLQREGKKRMKLDEFIKGYKFIINDKLNV